MAKLMDLQRAKPKAKQKEKSKQKEKPTEILMEKQMD